MFKLKNINYRKLQLTICFVFCLGGSVAASAQCLSGNCENGEGLYKLKSGATYEGTSVNGDFEGNGVYKFVNGDMYKGSFVKNKFDGQGTFTWKNGDQYAGAYKNGKRHGYAVMTYADGDVYEGNYVNDVKEGQGKTIYKSGSIFTGEYKNGKKNGTGKLFNKKQNIYIDGIWQDDVMIVQFPPKTSEIVTVNKAAASVRPAKNSTAQALNPNNEGKELFEAIDAGNTPLALELIKKGMNTHYQGKSLEGIDEREVTLSLAVAKNNSAVVKALLAAGADPDLNVENIERNALTEAIRYNRLEIFELLINAKADVNVKFESGTTPLMLATHTYNKPDARFVELLLKSGADPNVYDKYDFTPLGNALSSDNRVSAGLLYESSNDEIKAKAEKQARKSDEVMKQIIAENEIKKRERQAAKINASNSLPPEESAQTKAYKQNLALAEYNKIHSQIESDMRTYVAAINKYRKAGEAQFLYKGTAASIVNTKNRALETINKFLKEHGKYLPEDMRRHLEDDASKFVDAPSY